MQRVVVARPGGVDRLIVEDGPDPAPAAAEVCVKVRGAGVNFADLVVRMGQYRSAREFVGWPVTPGFEVSGVVAGVGEGVETFREGDQVIALTRFGGYASHLCIPEAQVVSLPAGVDPLVAAGFPVAFLTAWYALSELSRLRPGYRVLVHSAAGGVGGALVTLAKRASCVVVAVVGASHKVPVVEALGADVVIDQSREPLWPAVERAAPEGFHVVLDANGGETLRQSYRHVRPGGRLIVYGFHSLLGRGKDRLGLLHALVGLLRTPRFNPLKMVDVNRGVLAFNLSYMFHETALFREAMNELMGWLERGEIRPLPVTPVPFAEVREAHRMLHSGTSTGKIVLVL